MYSQVFSTKALYACTTQSERRNLGLDKEELMQLIDDCLGTSLLQGTYNFQIKKSGELYVNAHPKASAEYLCQNLILRKLFCNIRRIYNVRQADRNSVVKHVCLLAKEKIPLWVIRMDVKHFYESIDCKRILDKIQQDARLNYQSIELIHALFHTPCVSVASGLPRGMNISAALAEIYMKSFDHAVRRSFGVYYYARFVDDIIVFCTSKEARDYAWAYMIEQLRERSLEVNTEKSFLWGQPSDRKELTYLGYSLTKEGKKVQLTIAGAKVKKIKTRLVRSFVSYAKDRNYELLRKRVQFLTGNYTLFNPTTLTPIQVGIYFNYRLITDYCALKELDSFYRKLLACRSGTLGSRLTFSDDQRQQLGKYSFAFGHEHHVHHYFTVPMMQKIKKCWL